MNSRMIDAAAAQHIRELQDQAAHRRASTARDDGHPAHRGPVSGLRSHVGFALVEAGFFVLGSHRLARD